MAFDEGLAQRLREQLGGTAAVAEKRMFGGLAFLVDGNMCVGVIGDELIARVGATASETATGRPGARTFDFSGRPMKGWVTVDQRGLDDDALAGWVDESLSFVRTLPAK